MRGAHPGKGWYRAIVTIIPAYAGSTRSCWTTRARDGDHPRVCGEHMSDTEYFKHATGSSPRMRRAPQSRADGLALLRIIPAYAGSTSYPIGTEPHTGDHPRVCGEHGYGLANSGVKTGSSPRMRGALTIKYSLTGPDGIIPAYAGSTSLQSGLSRFSGDHPRVCGEHFRRSLPAFVFRGSSPRMRGAQGMINMASNELGIIPAYAGSTVHHQSDQSR